MDLEKMAEQARSFYEKRKRNDDSEFYTLKDGAPEWLGEMNRAAHGDMLPDDHRYAMIVQALDAISEGDKDGDNVEAPIYTSELCTWLGSSNLRLAFCDEAASDYSLDASATMEARIQYGWMQEYREVHSAVLAALQEREDEDEDEDDSDE